MSSGLVGFGLDFELLPAEPEVTMLRGPLRGGMVPRVYSL